MRHVDPEAAAERLGAMLDDPDERVLPNVLEALAAVGAPGAGATLTACLEAPDVVVRRTAARLMGELRPASGDAALAAAYRGGLSDPSYLARAAALRALAAYGLPAARETLRAALADPDWAVRVVAADLLADLEPGDRDFARAIRPAPGADADYGAPDLVAPSISPHVYIETDRGTIQIELAVLDAPLTADNFMRPRPPGVLRRALVPPGGAQLRRPGRRPAPRHRRGARLHAARRAERPALPARHRRHGARLARHGGQPVLHHPLAPAAPRRPLHGLRPRGGRNGGGRRTAAGRPHPPRPGVGRPPAAGATPGGVQRGLRSESR